MKKGIALPFPASWGCSQHSCMSRRKSRLLLASWHGLWHSCGAGSATERCAALPSPSHQVTKVSARGEVSSATCQERSLCPRTAALTQHLGGRKGKGEAGEKGRRQITCRHSLLQLAWPLERAQLGSHRIRGLRHCQVKGKSSHR